MSSGVWRPSKRSCSRRSAAAYLGPDAATVGPQYLMVRPSMGGGDLVLLHASGVHGLILLAVPSVLLARTAMSRVRQLWVTAVAVAGVTIAMMVLLVQALRELPLEQLHPWR